MFYRQNEPTQTFVADSDTEEEDSKKVNIT